MGIHLFASKAAGKTSNPLSLRRAWFQLKGKHASTVSAAQLASAKVVPVGKIRLDSLRFWYAQPEPVYLTVYLEATDEFLVEGIQAIVDRQWGISFFDADTFQQGQKEVTLHVDRAAVLNDQVWAAIASAAPMIRVDGPRSGAVVRWDFVSIRCDLPWHR